MKMKLEQGNPTEFSDLEQMKYKSKESVVYIPPVIPVKLFIKIHIKKALKFITALVAIFTLLYSVRSSLWMFPAKSDQGVVSVSVVSPAGGVYAKGNILYVSTKEGIVKNPFTNIIHGFGFTVDAAIVAVRSGNYDYLEKDLNKVVSLTSADGIKQTLTKPFPSLEGKVGGGYLDNSYVVECLSESNCVKGSLLVIPHSYIYGQVNNYQGVK